MAKLELSEKDKKLFTTQLNEILRYFRKIDEADVKDLEPTYHVMELKNVLREDKPVPPLPTKQALQNAPEKEKDYIKAPKIV